MSSLKEEILDLKPNLQPEHDCLVVGGGPVGIRIAHELLQRGLSVRVLSAETLPPYNRVRLTPLLSGEVQFGEILLSEIETDGEDFDLRLGHRVESINREEQFVTTADGSVWPYNTLILATGSRAFVPGIPGRELPGVMTFRTAEDASALLARSFSARRVAVIGGGLLGLEAARGMRKRQCDVTVIEHESHLMPRQLDREGGALLAENIETLGVNVITGVAVKEITGSARVRGLTLANGEKLECDTVIICTGVRANSDLARDARLAFSRGIIVNDAMQTSDPHIYAVGECAEVDGQLYGLVGPGYAQAEVAAAVIAGETEKFTGSTPATKLKVIGADVLSVGDVEQFEVQANTRSHIWQDGKVYRRIFIERGKLVGAIGVGAWAQSSRVQDAVQTGATVFPWMLYRFRKTGTLWPDGDVAPAEMPDGATLCNCTGVSCGQVRKALSGGAGDVEGVGVATGAGTVCGTCRPLLAEMIEADAPPQAMPLWKPVLALSALAMLGALLPLMLGYVPLPESYDAESLRTWLWRDNIVKQWSGFILLGITLLAFTIGLRKRFRFMDRFGGFDGWRLVHIGVGMAALIGLLAHTGFNLGENLNLALGIFYIVTLGLGAAAGLATGGDHELRARKIGSARKPPRRLPTWAHIIAVWPVPALLLLHVLASYAF
jgi:nitrite reductase (NADH) large subunit